MSLLSQTNEQSQMSVAMIGNEGVVGLPALLGIGDLGYQAVVTAEGSTLRMNSADLLWDCDADGMLPELLKLYTNLYITKLSQLLVCTRFHRTESQLICWLLMMQDRLETSEFTITQSDLANLLGVRREQITLLAGSLQKEQLISYTRGHLTIPNREGLEAAACACYRIIKAEEQMFLG